MTQTFLPYITSGPTPAPPSQPDGQGSIQTGYENALLELLNSDPRQQRKGIIFDPKLTGIARARVKAMGLVGREGWEHHVDPDGHWPHWWLRQGGYQIPSGWPDSANYVESLAYGGGLSWKPSQIWAALTSATDDAHRVHLLAEDSFYKTETHVGIGAYYLASSKWQLYISIITAPPEPGS